MLRHISEPFVGTVTKFDMAGVENLLRVWGNDGNVEEVVTAVA
jgi:hypothetical protein